MRSAPLLGRRGVAARARPLPSQNAGRAHGVRAVQAPVEVPRVDDAGPSTSGRPAEEAGGGSRRAPRAVQGRRAPSRLLDSALVSFNEGTELAADKQQREEEQKRRDFYANVGDAIRTLREDIPVMFHRDLNYSIYREDIVFRDPNLSFHGLKNYKLIFWSLRFHGNIFFSAIYVDVQRIWQPDDAQIKMRWKVYAKPRLWGQEGQFDGLSTYRLDRTGKIYEHSVDNVQLRDPPITNPLLYFYNFFNLTPVTSQVPVPGSWAQGGREEEMSLTALPMATANASATSSWDE